MDTFLERQKLPTLTQEYITSAFSQREGRTGHKKQCHNPHNTQIHTLKAADPSPSASPWSPLAVIRAGKCILISKWPRGQLTPASANGQTRSWRSPRRGDGSQTRRE